MSFTADHLARLKEKLAKCEASQSGRPLDKMGVILDYPEAKALVERMEAAERCIHPTYCDEEMSDFSDDHKAWLASKGEK